MSLLDTIPNSMIDMEIVEEVDDEPINIEGVEASHVQINFESGSIDAIMKTIESPDTDTQKSFMREIMSHAILNHELLEKQIGFSLINKEGNPSLISFTEFFPFGSLESLMEKQELGEELPSSWDATTKSKIAFGIAASMAYLHDKKIIHRNLNPASIMCDSNLEPKLCNFLLARTHTKMSKTFIMPTAPVWSAPEILSGSTNYDEKIDQYSYGLILWYLLTGEQPFSGVNPFKLPIHVSQGSRPEIPPDCPQILAQLIESCWSADPEQRPAFSLIVQTLRRGTVLFPGSDKRQFMNFVQKIMKLPVSTPISLVAPPEFAQAVNTIYTEITRNKNIQKQLSTKLLSALFYAKSSAEPYVPIQLVIRRGLDRFVVEAPNYEFVGALKASLGEILGIEADFVALELQEEQKVLDIPTETLQQLGITGGAEIAAHAAFAIPGLTKSAVTVKISNGNDQRTISLAHSEKMTVGDLKSDVAFNVRVPAEKIVSTKVNGQIAEDSVLIKKGEVVEMEHSVDLAPYPIQVLFAGKKTAVEVNNLTKIGELRGLCPGIRFEKGKPIALTLKGNTLVEYKAFGDYNAKANSVYIYDPNAGQDLDDF